ncbi:28S ribosomal protein S29, mitochondrial [Agrilus planipennis]|uniref:Small ribosomal subunit protein mS29 n=1 Tax=Agrilus planipennis TaxID=224129 RepID=A0A1W4X4E1_AGRPL|nr:28S ribosomal protein S29, mitochondrial [Agrilus planipennis]
MFKKPRYIFRYNKNPKSLITSFQCLTTAALPTERIDSFRCVINNPLEQNEGHIGQFYRVPEDVVSKLFSQGGLPKSFRIQTKTFAETCLMIRKPSIDIINCIKNLDFSKPVPRFVLYGQKGVGKSLSLAHIVHYGYEAGFLLVHIPWLGEWMRRPKDSSPSETKEGYTNINLDIASWLVHFKNQNSLLLEKANLKTTQTYKWTKREETVANSNLMDLVDHGINRIKFASDCVLALLNEIKQLSKSGKCKTLVAIDGFNAFFYPETRIRTEKKEIVHPHNVSVTEGFLSLTRFDWKNAVAVLIVDELAIAEKDQTSYFPRYLLGKDGFEHLDPFIPVLVNGYSNKEFLSCMNYYRERRWVQPLPGLDDELSVISSSNPYKLMQLCAPL